MKSLIFSLFAMALMSTFSLPVSAFHAGACKEDAEKYCKGVPMEEGKLKECLLKNREKLSDQCKANIVDAAMKKKESEKK